ncbi:ParB N-terminal domain-containing protein [Escherichia coli]|nr:ParB N-terminal domain-containing protein [Escherichia coli]
MSEKLKIVYRPLQELSPYAHNARTHSTEQVAQLVESIKQFGWTNPVLIDEKGEIIAGHGRVMAAEMLKMDSVPVIVLSGLTDEQKKAYRLADNRLPMNAGWDEDLLRMELSDLINADFDVSLTGFGPTEIDELLTDVLSGTGNKEEPYTTKIDTPVYEPSGGKPDNWWRNGQNLYLDNLEATGLYQVPLSAAQPGDVLLCCFGSSVPNHAAIYCGDSELLHHIPEQLSKRERYTDKWQRRTHSLWRHRAWHASAFTGIYNDLAAASTFE